MYSQTELSNSFSHYLRGLSWSKHDDNHIDNNFFTDHGI